MTLWLRYALKNLRSGLRGFWIFLTCLTLGVAAIAIIGSLSAAIERGIAEQGQPLLGGDVEFSLIHREVDARERAYIDKLGTVNRLATVRAMATSNGASTLVEIKATDAAYPLYGTLAFADGNTWSATDTALPYPVAVDDLLLGRLNVKVGDVLRLGKTEVRVAAVIATEPDRISDGVVLGPRLLMSHAALTATQLVQPGSLITWRYRVKLNGDTSLKTAKAIVEKAAVDFPDAGWRVRARDNAASGAERFVERLGYFMTLVGISALVIGGAGIANAVSAFVTQRRTTIATLKCIGLSSRDVTGLFLTEIMVVALLGIAVAIGLGAVAPLVAARLFGDVLPLPLALTPAAKPLLFAGALGLLVTFAFALLPLARIATIPGAALFRGHAVESTARPAWRPLAAAFVLLALAAGLVLLAFDNARMTAMFLAGLAGAFVLLSVLAWILVRAVALLPKSGNVLVRQAVAAMHRPGASTLSVILALGLGLTLFVALALTDVTISRELRAGIPDKAPAFFFLDVPNTDLPAFKDLAMREPGVGDIGNAPMLRGRVVSVKGVASADVKATPEASWALRGDRGLTYADALPKGSELVEGQWWPKDYAGPNLVSMVDEIADGIGVKIGDKIVVNVLGRDVEAEVANLRRVNWRSLGINFVMVFSPGALKSAPHSHVVTVEMNGGDEAKFLNVMAAAFPSATAVRVKDALATVSDLLGQMLAAVRGANALTLLTGVLVLSGALAAGLANRTYEAVVLKTYGASRRQLLLSFLLEYGILGLVAAVFGIIVGALGAWYLSSAILELPFVFDWWVALLTAGIAMVVTVGAGMLVTARALSVKPAGHLRND